MEHSRARLGRFNGRCRSCRTVFSGSSGVTIRRRQRTRRDPRASVVAPAGSGAGCAQDDGEGVLRAGGIMAVGLGQIAEAAVAAHDGDGRVDQAGEIAGHVAHVRPAAVFVVGEVAAWMCEQGLPVSPGTLASSIHRMMPVFAPLSQAILAHLKAAPVLHGDETGWRVQSLKAIRGTSRAWLWCAVSGDAVWFHVDARRNAEAAAKLFAGVGAGTILVCDAYSADKKLARVLGGILILAWCWAHVRRKFIEAAAGNDALEKWADRWLDRIGKVYHLNAVRLKHYNPDVGMDQQSRKFGIAHRRVKRAVDRLFALAEKERAGPAGSDLRAKALNSLLRHRDGLCVFVDRPDVPMDNNLSERVHRGPVIARKLSFGSDSLKGALFSAMMYGIIETLRMNGIDVRTWLDDWLSACAANGGQPPDDLSPWLPWSMDEDRRRQLKAAR